MRISSCLRSAVMLFAASLPIVLRAQFQEPTSEELKMTSDPAAPGAAAVYLYYEEIDNDPLHYQSIYARIKVLTDKGKDLATVDLPYLRSEYKITNISGRTIHPDGTRQAGPLLLVRPRVLGSDARDVPGVMDGEARMYPIELGHPGVWTDSYDIRLPAGYTLDEAPDPVNLDLPFASYSSTVAAKGDVLHFEREYVVKQVDVPAAQAATFRELEDAIIDDEKGMAVLKKQ